MADYYCKTCGKTIKLIQKKKHLNTKSYLGLSESIFNKYCGRNPELIEIEEISQKHVSSYYKIFEFLQILRKWKL